MAISLPNSLKDFGTKQPDFLRDSFFAWADVLSFPLYKNLAEIKKTLRREKVFLGDIFICESIAKKQVARLGPSLKTEIKELAIHGLLHLLGYDHQNKKQVIKMLKAQRKLFSL